MDDISKNIDFSRKNKVFFRYKIPICIFILMIFPIFESNFETCFFFHISHIFRFFVKKWKITYCIKLIKPNIFESNSPYVHIISEISRKTPFMTILEKNVFFFQTFRKCTYWKNQTKNQFHLNNGENDYFSTSISRKINEIFQFHTMVTRLNSSTFWSVLSVWSWPPPAYR